MASVIGRSLPRLEDLRLVSGKGRYTDDVVPDGACHAFVLRAAHASARIEAIRADPARAMPGVLAVLIAADYAADGHGPIPHNVNPPDAIDGDAPSFSAADGYTVFTDPQPPLAHDRVRYMGEAVALVIAETLSQARDAAELIEVDYKILPAVIDADAAIDAGAPQLLDTIPGNTPLDARKGDLEQVEQIFSAAHVVVEHRFHHQRIVNCQMEPRAAHAVYDAIEGRLTIVAGSQGVVRQRVAIAQALRMPIERIRLICPDVGGGFGPRTSLNPEVVLVAWAAKRLGRPVRWTSDRTDAFLTDYQARDQFATVALAFDANGLLQALRSDQLYNLGAYPVSFAPPANGYRVLTTVYDVPAAAVRIRGVLTNTAPTVPYRGAGRPEATHAVERLMDIAAQKLGIDRLELRRRNLIGREKLPYLNAMGLTYDSGDFCGNMDRALDAAHWKGFEARARESRSNGRLRGIGIANYVEAPVGAPREKVTVTILPDGGVDIVAGTQSTGQSHETTFAQVVSEYLGVPVDRIKLRTGDTDFVKVGGGSHSDRSMRLAGTILVNACESIIAEGREKTALLLQRDLGEVEFRDGMFSVPGGGRSFTLADLAQLESEEDATGRGANGLSATAEISKRLPAHPTGCAVCELEVDRSTGVVTIVRYTSVDDVGQPINPMIVDGQVHGGIVQGVGQALFEGLATDPESGQVTGASFMDYCMPRADALPNFDVQLAEDPTAGNPLRVKGAGEGGITPATAAVINALAHALREFGVVDIDMPATPYKIWSLMQQARANANCGGMSDA